MNPKQKTMAWLGGGVGLVVVGTLVMFVLARGWTFEPPPKLVLSKETTWFTGPVLQDGGIDWVAALEMEARANGLKDEENGAPLMKEAVQGIVDPWEWIEKDGKVAPPAIATERGDEERGLFDAIDDAIEAAERGEFDAANVDAVLAWVDACAPALVKAKEAAERPRWLLIPKQQVLSLMPTLSELDGIEHLMLAFRLRLATRSARGEVDGALADAAAACFVARSSGSPASHFEQSMALWREVEVLEQLLRCVRSTPALPADRAWESASRQPARWNGEAALREVLRADRLSFTSLLVALLQHEVREERKALSEDDRAVAALQRIDPTPHFQRLQRTFDELETHLLGSSRSARDRFDATLKALQALEIAEGAAHRRNRWSLAFLPVSDEGLVTRFVDRELGRFARLLTGGLRDWLALTAQRDALLAELAFLAGAPERRDSWLGEPLIVTRKEDGSLAVGGALIELARERGSTLDEEE